VDQSKHAIPVLNVGIPIFRGCDPTVFARIIHDEPEACIRFRYIVSDFAKLSEDGSLTDVKIRELYQKVEYEVSRIDLEYRNLLRKREQSLAGVLIGTIGLTLCAIVSDEFREIAKTLFGATSIASGMKYLFNVQETDHSLRRSDYYSAWKVWKSLN